MVSALLVFLNMFKTHKAAIAHYDATRTKDGKGLTIRSQRRYVKFFTGFLYLKLADFDENGELVEPTSWLELALRKHNYGYN